MLITIKELPSTTECSMLYLIFTPDLYNLYLCPVSWMKPVELSPTKGQDQEVCVCVRMRICKA